MKAYCIGVARFRRSAQCARTATTGQLQGVVRDPSGSSHRRRQGPGDQRRGRHARNRNGPRWLVSFHAPPARRISRGDQSARLSRPPLLRTSPCASPKPRASTPRWWSPPRPNEVVNVTVDAAVVQANSPVTGRVVDELTIRENSASPRETSPRSSAFHRRRYLLAR